MKRRKIIILSVLSVFLASSVYAAEGQSWWQSVRSRFFAPKPAAAVKEAAPKAPAAAKTGALPGPKAIEKKADAAPVKQEVKGPAPKKHSEMTKEELLEDIKDNVESEEGILDLVPSLKKGKDASGKDIYLFQGSPLENAGREDLEKLAVTVGQVSAKMRADRIQGQLDTIRQAQAINQLQRIQAGVPRPPVPPPAIQRPPAPPGVQQPPRPPSAPPTTRR